jgi:hypothetical protein
MRGPGTQVTRPLAVSSEPRVLLALALQPLLAALLAAALVPLVDITGRPLYGGRPMDMVDAAVAFALGISIVAAAITLFGECPVLLWLLRRGPVRRRHALVSGLILGNVPTALVTAERVLKGAGTSIPAGGLLEAVYGPAGAIRAVVFELCGAASGDVRSRVSLRCRSDGCHCFCRVRELRHARTRGRCSRPSPTSIARRLSARARPPQRLGASLVSALITGR